MARTAELNGEGLYEVLYDDKDKQHMTESDVRRFMERRARTGGVGCSDCGAMAVRGRPSGV